MLTTPNYSGRFQFPTPIAFGPGVLRTVGAEVASLGRHAFIVTDPGLVQAGIIDEVRRALEAAGVACSVFAGVRENPTDADVLAGRAALDEAGADLIVAVGGGSALDAGKLIRLMQHHAGELADYDVMQGGDRKVTERLAPLVAVPTTAGTGSEVSRSAVVTIERAGRKIVIFSPRLLPSLAVCDPELTAGLPPRLTAATGADALTHAIEAYMAKGFHPMADALALQAVGFVFRYLRRAVVQGSDLEARTHMMLASMLGAVAFQKGLGACHAMAHALTAVHGTHHGLANAICLPAVIAFNAEVAVERVRELDRAVGNGLGLLSNQDAASHFQFELHALLEEAGIPASLRLAGIERPDFERLTALASIDGCRLDNPREAGPAELRGLFEQVAR